MYVTAFERTGRRQITEHTIKIINSAQATITTFYQILIYVNDVINVMIIEGASQLLNDAVPVFDFIIQFGQ